MICILVEFLDILAGVLRIVDLLPGGPQKFDDAEVVGPVHGAPPPPLRQLEGGLPVHVPRAGVRLWIGIQLDSK